MKRLFIISVLVLGFLNSFCASLIPCKLILKDSSVLIGFANIPDMMDAYIKYQSDEKADCKKILNEDLISAVFTKDNKEVFYQRVLTYKNYGNKRANKTKTWLQVLKIGYMSYYYGFQSGYNSPSMKLWYCKKSNDTIAYFISMKYSGGLAITVGTGSTFRGECIILF